MALQSSGQIKLSEIATEFGGSAPHSLSEYYGSDTVPSSGMIKLSDFYGTSNIAYRMQGTVTTGSQAGNKSPLTYRGFIGSGGGAITGTTMGSINSTSISGTSAYITGFYFYDDNSSGAIPGGDQDHVSFNTTFDTWTGIVIAGVTILRSNMIRQNNGKRYERRYNVMNATNKFGSNGSQVAVGLF